MAAKHGTRRCYIDGCRCDPCTEANRIYKREYRQRRAAGVAPRPGVPIASVTVIQPETRGAGPVESAVELEIEGLVQAEVRPGLTAAALALARLLDDPKAVNQKPAAAGKLAELLDKLHKGADARKSRLASVRAMTRAKTG